MHWFTHKKVCKILKEQREKQEAESAELRMQQSKEESNALQEATDSMQEMSVESDSDGVFSSTSADTINSSPVATGDN
ncbi:ankyrin repeat and MYND domain-containing protein 2-like [Thalassophryne amazonica]|nr:ankyrin repeat and MYND domain-containing protein 2-like [Thalassophryne amazonica]